MGITGLENQAVGDEPIGVRFLYSPLVLPKGDIVVQTKTCLS